MTTSTRLDPSPLVHPQFILVDGDCPSLFSFFTDFFRTKVENIYGTQPRALTSIRERRDLLCEMLVDKEIPKGLIVYQPRLTSDSELEVRNFSLLDPAAAEAEGLNLHMLAHIKAIAAARFARIIVTYTNSPAEKEFLEHQGFKIEKERSVASSCSEYTLKMQLEETRSLPPSKRMCVEKGGEQTAIAPKGQSGEAPLERTGARESLPTHIESCTLKREYIEQIRSGAKTVEGRVNTPLFQRYKEGMLVRWYGSDSEVLTRIVSIKRYPSFEEMLKGVGFKRLLPLVSSESQAASEYHKIPTYSDKVKRFGAVAFEVEVVLPQSGLETSRKRDRSE